MRFPVRKFFNGGRGSPMAPLINTVGKPIASPASSSTRPKVPGVVAWYETASASSVDVTGSSINRFLDISGNANHTNTQTSTKRAVYTANQLNGKAVANTTAASFQTYQLPAALLTLPAGACTIYSVSRRSADVNAIELIYNFGTGGTNTQLAAFYANVGQLLFRAGAAAGITYSPTFDTSQWIVQTNGFNGSTLRELGINNGQLNTDTSGATSAGTTSGYLFSRSDTQLYLDGQFAEIIFCTGLHSVGQQNIINNYLLKKWGITSGASLATVTGYDVIALLHQSNMIGRNGPIDPTLDAVNTRIAQWGRTAPYNNTVILAKDPLDNIGATANTVGPGLTFAKQVLANFTSPDRGVMLVPCAQGATGYNNNFWNPGNALYTDAVTRINAAVASGPNNRLVALIKQGGEQDYTDAQAVYDGVDDAFLDQLRIDVNAPTVPYICGGCLPGGVQTGAGVSASQTAMPSRRNYTGYADPSVPTVLTGGGDNLHYTADSCRQLGVRYWGQYVNAQNNH